MANLNNPEDLTYLFGLASYLDFLKDTRLPIFIYGMGDGCMKLLSIFAKYGIPCAGIFASDEFVREKTFMGHKIRKLSEIEAAVEEFIVALAFGAGYRSLIEKIDGIASRHRLIVPDMPVIGEGLFTKEYLKEHFDRVSEVYHLLSDEQSRLVYRKLLEYRLTGDISPLKECETDKTESYRLLSLGDKESYADLGAYTGDTIAEFLSAANGAYSKIIAIEPNARNFRKLSENTQGLENILLVNGAAGQSDGVITVSKGGGRMIKRSISGVEISQVALDSVVGGQTCTYIKYDVEGAEKDAIKGSENTILMNKPKLNVALYHRVEDIYSLPLYIHSILPEHKLYIRHFPYYPAWDTNLYAIP